MTKKKPTPKPRDATPAESMEVIISPWASKHGLTGDDQACALALELSKDKRIAKGCHPSIGNGIAYVRLATNPDELVRFELDPQAKALIKHFDKTGYFPPSMHVWLLPPAKRPLGSRKGEAHGSEVRSGKGANVLHRAKNINDPATRHVRTKGV